MKPEINKLDVKIVEAGNTTESNTQTPLRSNQNIISNAYSSQNMMRTIKII